MHSMYETEGWFSGSIEASQKLARENSRLLVTHATTGFSAKWRLRNECRNSILMTRHYPDLGSASDWLNQISHAARPIRGTTQIWVVTRHQYGISALVSLTSSGGENSGGVAKSLLFIQATQKQI